MEKDCKNKKFIFKHKRIDCCIDWNYVEMIHITDIILGRTPKWYPLIWVYCICKKNNKQSLDATTNFAKYTFFILNLLICKLSLKDFGSIMIVANRLAVFKLLNIKHCMNIFGNDSCKLINKL